MSMTSPAPKRLQALIADDNADFADLIQDMFTAYVENAADFEFVTELSGEAACARLKKQRFDFVILDVNLPGISGYEVVHTLKHSETPNRDTPILMISGDLDAAPSSVRELSQYDNLYFIEKGTQIDRIIRKISLFLGPGKLQLQGI